jgi:uncharacterized protein YciW
VTLSRKPVWWNWQTRWIKNGSRRNTKNQQTLAYKTQTHFSLSAGNTSKRRLQLSMRTALALNICRYVAVAELQRGLE